MTGCVSGSTTMFTHIRYIVLNLCLRVRLGKRASHRRIIFIFHLVDNTYWTRFLTELNYGNGLALKEGIVSNTKRFSSPKNGKERGKYYYFHYTSCMVVVGRGILYNYYSPVGVSLPISMFPCREKIRGENSPSIVQLVQGIISMANFSSANKENHAYIHLHTTNIALSKRTLVLLLSIQ